MRNKKYSGRKNDSVFNLTDIILFIAKFNVSKRIVTVIIIIIIQFSGLKTQETHLQS